MQEDAKKLLGFLLDYSDGKREQEQVIKLESLREIADTQSKVSRLLKNLQEEKYFLDYKFEEDTVAVTFSDLGIHYFDSKIFSSCLGLCNTK